MNHCVPDFHELEDDFSIPTSSGIANSRPKRPEIGEEEIMELFWQNGQVVAQTQKSSKKAPMGDCAEEEPTPQQHLFMQEDEMASWLQYPLDVSSFDRDMYSDLLYSAPPPSTPIATLAPRPVADIRPFAPPPPQPAAEVSGRLQNFPHISRIPARFRNELGQTTPANVRVDTNETPVAGQVSKANVHGDDVRSGPVLESAELAADFTVSSSPSCSGASLSASADRPHPSQKPAPESVDEDRKRKARETGYNEDTEFEPRGSTSTKKSRAAEVHNLSERRRRDRINEKMKALQELIPRCNKSDKASMLDEAIEYLKSLQLQVQMMSMGCGMIPMMYPGLQQYMPVMGMGIGMGMSIDMNMNRPIVPYPSMLPGSALQHSAAVAHMNACFPMPAFHLPPTPAPDPSRIQSSTQTGPMPNSTFVQNPNKPRMPNVYDSYQQFLGAHQTQPPLPQTQAAVQPIVKQPSSSKETGNL